MRFDVAFDTSDRSVVAVCTCGARDVFASSSAAYDWAQAHMRVAHPDEIPVLVAAKIRAGVHRYR